MAEQFPETLFVKIGNDNGNEYYVTDEDAAALVEMNDTVKIATYKLVETSLATGEARFSKPKHRFARRS